MSDETTSSTESVDEKKAPLGLTQAEFNDVKTMLRMAGAIFLAISTTLIIVALVSTAVGGA